MKINLLPNEMTVPSSVVALKKGLFRWSIVLIIILFVLTISFIAYFLIISAKQKSLINSTNDIKRQISSNEQTEQQMFVLKDRLNKIKNIQKEGSLIDLIVWMKDFSAVIGGLNGGFNETDISGTSIETTVVLPDIISLKTLLTYFDQNDFFKNISLASINYSPLSGYSAKLVLNLK